MRASSDVGGRSSWWHHSRCGTRGPTCLAEIETAVLRSPAAAGACLLGRFLSVQWLWISRGERAPWRGEAGSHRACPLGRVASTGSRAFSRRARSLALRPRLAPGLPFQCGLAAELSRAERDLWFCVPDSRRVCLASPCRIIVDGRPRAVEWAPALWTFVRSGRRTSLGILVRATAQVPRSRGNRPRRCGWAQPRCAAPARIRKNHCPGLGGSIRDRSCVRGGSRFSAGNRG